MRIAIEGFVLTFVNFDNIYVQTIFFKEKIAQIYCTDNSYIGNSGGDPNIIRGIPGSPSV